MKLFLVITSVVALWAAETYGNANDSIDIEAVVGNVDTLKAYYGCFVGTSPCDAVQTSFKEAAPAAIIDACAKCTPSEKHNLNRFLTALKEKLPDSYKNLRKTYDPENKYYDALEAAIAKS